MIKIQNFGQNSKFWLKFKISVKIQNFGQNSKFWSKYKILVKIQNFGQKSKFWSKFKILVKIQTFGQNSKFCSKIKIVVKIQNFGQKYNIHKIVFLSTNKNAWDFAHLIWYYFSVTIFAASWTWSRFGNRYSEIYCSLGILSERTINQINLRNHKTLFKNISILSTHSRLRSPLFQIVQAN